MSIRLVLLAAALLAVPAAATAGGLEGGDDAAPTSVLSRMATAAARIFPRGEFTIQAEDGDYEARLSFTLLDRAPDWRHPGSVLRGFLRNGLR